MSRSVIRRSRWLYGLVRWSLKYVRFLDPHLILSHDLYEGSPQLHRSSPTPFTENHNRFDLKDIDDSILQDSILHRLYQLPDLVRMISLSYNMADVEDKLTPIQSFLGPLFPLLVEEKIAILFGLTNVQLKLENSCNNATDFNARSLGYSTVRLRECGEQLFQSCWLKTTTFDNERYLSMLQQDIIYDINQFEPSSEVLVEFMKRQTMYQIIQSYRGAMKYGPIKDYEEYLQAKQNLQNITAVGSFYTLIGICWIKFGKEATAKQLIGNKIINGPNGLIRLTTQLSRT